MSTQVETVGELRRSHETNTASVPVVVEPSEKNNNGNPAVVGLKAEGQRLLDTDLDSRAVAPKSEAPQRQSQSSEQEEAEIADDFLYLDIEASEEAKAGEAGGGIGTEGKEDR